MWSKILSRSFYGFLAGIVLVLLALDMVVLSKGLLPLEFTLVINLVVIGAVFLLYSRTMGEHTDKLFYSFWGLLLILIGISLLIYWLSADAIMGAAVFIAGLGGLIAYMSLSQR